MEKKKIHSQEQKEIGTEHTKNGISLDKAQQAIKYAAEVSSLAFVLVNKIRSEKGVDILFDKRPWLKEPYDDWTQEQACSKSSQCGWSTMEIIKSMFGSGKKGLNIIYCVDTKTEALSKRGFLKYNEITLDDELLTLDLKGIAKWSKVEEVFVNDVNTTMYEYDARNFNAFTTENHRWIVHNNAKDIKWNITTSKDLHKKYKFIPKTIDKSYNLFPKKTLNDDYVKLLAWIFSEGYYVKQKNDNSIIITQSKIKNKDKCDEIRRILSSLEIKWKEYLHRRGDCINFRFAYEYGKKIKDRFPNKSPDAKFVRSLTKKQCKIFIDTFVDGDGWIDNFGTKSIIQKSKETIDIIAMIAVLAGYAPSIVKPSKNNCYTLRLTQFRNVHTLELNPKIHNNWSGKIWCPRTNIGTFYARRNGRCYWTGNTLPTRSDINAFVGSKVNPIIDNNPIFTEWCNNKDSIFQKQVGNAFINYLGTKSTKSAREKTESSVGIMLTADLLIGDEADRSDQEMLNQYHSRLDSSDYRGMWYFSNPTHPHTLTQRLYKNSDQKHWFVKCSHCNKWFFLDYPRNIKNGKYICHYCNGEITNEDRLKGQWVKKYKDRDISGYWVNQLMYSWKSAKDIEKLKEEKTKQYFENFVMGRPYIGSDVMVDRQLILSCIDRTEPNFLQDNCLGVDVGNIKHFVLGNKQGIFKVGTFEDWKELDTLIKKYDVRRCVIDAMPDITTPKKFVSKYPGICSVCFFKREVKNLEFISYDRKSSTVYVDRTKIIDYIIDRMIDRKLRFQMEEEELNEFIKHWGKLYKIKEEDEKMQEVKEFWESTDSEDHYALATAYFQLALETVGEGLISEWSNDLTIKAHNPQAFDVKEVAKKHLIKEQQDWRI